MASIVWAPTSPNWRDHSTETGPCRRLARAGRSGQPGWQHGHLGTGMGGSFQLAQKYVLVLEACVSFPYLPAGYYRALCASLVLAWNGFSTFLLLCPDAHQTLYLFFLDKERLYLPVFTKSWPCDWVLGHTTWAEMVLCARPESGSEKPAMQSSSLICEPAGCWGSSEGPRGCRKWQGHEKAEPESLNHHIGSCLLNTCFEFLKDWDFLYYCMPLIIFNFILSSLM